MLLYQIRIALKSLRRSPVLTALLIAAIAVGICVSTTFVALRHMLGKDPLPGASLTLYHVRLDSWGGGEAWDPDRRDTGVLASARQVLRCDRSVDLAARAHLRSVQPDRAVEDQHHG